MEEYWKIKKKKTDIDFDAAYEAWRANKKQINPGVFVYICGAECYSRSLKTMTKCTRKTKCNQRCYQHKGKSIYNPNK